jgi:hypothetical protein
VIDPTASSTLYVAGPARVFQSRDAGLSWVPLGQEAVPYATSLAISLDGKHLYAGTSAGVFEYTLTGDANGPCTPSSDSLCLLGGRFRVTILATDPHRGRTSEGFAVAQGDRFGYFSLPDFTGDATLPEVFIKMVDGSCSERIPQVFYNGLPACRTPSWSPTRRPESGAPIRAMASAAARTRPPFRPRVRARGGHRRLASATTLSASGTELSLLGERFRVTLSATNPRDGRVTSGAAIAQGDRFGYFSLPDFTGDPNLPEVCVKMIDATSFDGNFWVFYTSLTSLSYRLTVTDSATGAVQTYQNGTAFYALCGGADTRAFPR